MASWRKLEQTANAQTRPMSRHRYRAFTLLELMVAIGIISILAALILPTLARSKLSARATGCISNLRQVGMALQLYADENESHYPTMFDAPVGRDSAVTTNLLPRVDQILISYLSSSNLLRCPADNRGLFEETGCSYAWNTLLNGQEINEPKLFNSRFNRHNVPLFFDREAFHRERGEGRDVNYLYADGHVENELVIEPPKPR